MPSAIGYGRDRVQVAKILSVTPDYIDDLLLIAGAPAQIRERVQAKLAVTLAVATMKKRADKAKDVLSAALENAGQGGKGRASAKHLPGHDRSKDIKKQRHRSLQRSTNCAATPRGSRFPMASGPRSKKSLPGCRPTPRRTRLESVRAQSVAATTC